MNVSVPELKRAASAVSLISLDREDEDDVRGVMRLAVEGDSLVVRSRDKATVLRWKLPGTDEGFEDWMSIHLDAGKFVSVLEHIHGDTLSLDFTQEGDRLNFSQESLKFPMSGLHQRTEGVYHSFDEALEKSEGGVTVPSETITGMLQFLKHPVSRFKEQECAYEIRGGSCISGDALFHARYKSPEFKGVNFRGNRIGVRPVRGFCDLCSGSMCLFSTERGTFFVEEASGSYLFIRATSGKLKNLVGVEDKAVSQDFCLDRSHLLTSLSILGQLIDRSIDQVKLEVKEEPPSLRVSAMLSAGEGSNVIPVEGPMVGTATIGLIASDLIGAVKMLPGETVRVRVSDERNLVELGNTGEEGPSQVVCLSMAST